MEHDQTIQGSVASVKDSIVEIALTSFDARLKILEKPEEKSLVEKLQKSMSFLALFIGITLSLISLFDIFWNKPREAIVRDLGEFNKAVNSVSSLRQSMIQLHFQSKDPELSFAMNSMATPQIHANIQYATALLPSIGDHVGIPQLLVLTSEAMNVYDWNSASILVERAIATKGAVPSLQAEAHRYKGRLMFSTGRLQEGRKAFEDSLNSIRNVSAFGVFGNRAYIVADWIQFEFAFGDCSVGVERIRQFVEYVQHHEVLPPLRSGLLTTLKTGLNQITGNNQRCSIPNELVLLN